MSSRFDYRDPGIDQAYCDGLSHEREQTTTGQQMLNFNSDGYPTDAALERLATIENSADALDFAVQLWHDGYGSQSSKLRACERATIRPMNKTDRFLRLATGGWSGNESVISALEDNRLVWFFTWRLSARGGLHIFEYPRGPK